MNAEEIIKLIEYGRRLARAEIANQLMRLANEAAGKKKGEACEALQDAADRVRRELP